MSLYITRQIPAEWAAPGLRTRLRDDRAPFGTIELPVTNVMGEVPPLRS